MKHLQISGVFPHLAVTHEKPWTGDGECGIGAVVSYRGRLYWITYPASVERGGAGRIYSMDASMERVECAQSTGGTHADRMIHRPSGALILGANVFFPDGTIRAFDVTKLIGRLTSAAEHPKSAEGWIYIASMEDGLYEANIYTMEVRTLRRDIIDRLRRGGVWPEEWQARNKLPGDHGKGFYTGQGVAIYANNGHGGVLAEWDQTGDAQDKARWKVIERAKFTEVTGAGGLFGPDRPEEPLWALGWDERSVMLCVREAGQWTRYRLPKASYTQDADHGWFTEWPRIRKAGGRYLMCMHGMLYEFPAAFRRGCAGGIRPLARHLKMISDWEDWQDGLVFACDDASCFDNPTMTRCQSNLWFSSWEHLREMSAPSAWGGLYVNEATEEGKPSDPFFVGGFDRKILHLHALYEYGGFTVEMDRDGSGRWEKVTEAAVPPNQAVVLELPEAAEWIRLVPDRDLSACTAYLYLSMNRDTPEDARLTEGLLKDAASPTASTGRLIALGGSDMRLGYLSNEGYYEADGQFHWVRREAPQEVLDKLRPAPPSRIEPRFYQTGHSVLVIDVDGRRYQLPWLPSRRDTAMRVREVVTERSLMNLCGTLYELPRPESGGVRRIKPVTTHDSEIEDYLSWRGMLVLSGVDRASHGEHIFPTGDGKAAVWCGVVDDLWSLGAPRGEGGPLCGTAVLAGEVSDPFLLAGYRRKTLILRHDQAAPVVFTVEVDMAANGDFVAAETFEVPAGREMTICLADSFVAHWVRFRTNASCSATALFTLRAD